MILKTLTKSEEQVMQVLWKLGKGFLKEIIDVHSRAQTPFQHHRHHSENPGGEGFRGIHRARPQQPL